MNNDQLLKKWLSDELNEAELNDFMGFDDFDLNTKIIEGAKHFKASNFSTVNSYEDFKKNTKLTEKKTPVIKLSSYKMLYRIAALFIIGISIYSVFFYNNLTTVQTLASNKTTFELPDASTVILNTESKAHYSKNKWSEKREVSLEGEAFFEVAKGSKFDVLTSGGIVSVVGTQFTVKNRDNYFEVKCFEGIVSVNSKGKSQRLTKGNTFRISEGVVTLDVTSNNKPNWLNNKSSFKSVPLYEVLNELERQYGVIIETDEKIDTKRMFTGGFIHNNFEQAITSVIVPLDLSYKKDKSNKITLFKTE